IEPGGEVVEVDRLLEVRSRVRELRRAEAIAPHGVMSLDDVRAIARLLPEPEKLAPESARRLKVPADAVEGLKASDRDQPFRGVPHALGEREGARVDVPDPRSGEALYLGQRRSESDLHLKLVEGARRCIGQPVERLERGSEVRRRLGERVALDGVLARMSV